MASNSFGNIFRITTWGESHGLAMGVVIDGCPAGVPITEEAIALLLKARAPGRTPFTSPRKEPDAPKICSGVFDGYTTGAPIAIIIENKDTETAAYVPMKDLIRPGHANESYLKKYGCFDYRGSGRASARETVCRVAAAAVAQALLRSQGIDVIAYLSRVGPIGEAIASGTVTDIRTARAQSEIFCPDPLLHAQMIAALTDIQAEGDSLGGVVSWTTSALPAGLGDPVYEKLEANLAKAMLSLPASKAFEIGEGVMAAYMKGSDHNDQTAGPQATNHAGGTLGGITYGLPVTGRVTFKPTSSIQKSQMTRDLIGHPQVITLPAGSRHDPCVAIRAVPIVEAMVWLVLADAWLLNRCARM